MISAFSCKEETQICMEKKFKSHPFSITLKQGCAKHAPNTGASERKNPLRGWEESSAKAASQQLNHRKVVYFSHKVSL